MSIIPYIEDANLLPRHIGIMNGFICILLEFANENSTAPHAKASRTN